MLSFDQSFGLLRLIPDPRRAEGKLIELGHVCCYLILVVVILRQSPTVSIVTFIKLNRRLSERCCWSADGGVPEPIPLFDISSRPSNPRLVEKIFR